MTQLQLLLYLEGFFQYHIEYGITSTVSQGFYWYAIDPREDTPRERQKFWNWYAKNPNTLIKEFNRHLAEWAQDH